MLASKRIINNLQACKQVCKKEVHMHMHTFVINEKHNKSYCYSALSAVHVQVCILRMHIFLFLLINGLQNCARAPYYVGKVHTFPARSGDLHTTHKEQL